MHDQIYKQMVHAGAAHIFEDKYCLDKVGNIIPESSPDVYGDPAKSIMKNAALIVHMDATGRNTSQTKDSKIDGERHMVHVGDVACATGLVRSYHFMTLPFILGNGEPVCCAVIIVQKTMTPEIVTGLKLWHLEGSIEDRDYF